MTVFPRKFIFAFIVCVMFLSLSFSAAFAEDTEMVSGIVVVSKGVVVLDTEFGEILVKPAAMAQKVSTLDGQLITVEGVVTETAAGGLEVVVKRVVE